MKTLTITLVFLIAVLFYRNIIAQDCFIVMKIKGTIVIESTGRTLQKDDQVCSTDNVIFKSKDAAAIVHSTSKGRYTLKANKSRISELEGMIVCAVSSALSKSKSTLDTRGNDSEYEEDLSERYCLIDGYEFAVNESNISDDNYFLLSFIHNGMPVEIRLNNKGNNVFIDRNTVMIPEIKESGQEYIDDAAIYLCSESAPGKRKAVYAFDLSFPDKEKLKEELSGYVDLLRLSGKADELIPEELEKYVTDTYGKINKSEFRNWLLDNILKK